jgi:hypothetical protein
VDENSDLITGAAAAAILGVDPSTVSRWSSDSLQPEARKLTPVVRAGGYKFFRRSDVEALAAELAETRSA